VATTPRSSAVRTAVHPHALHADARRVEPLGAVGRSFTRRFSPRATVAGSNSSRSARRGTSGRDPRCDRRRDVARHALDGLGQREVARSRNPVAEQVQTEARVAEERQMAPASDSATAACG